MGVTERRQRERQARIQVILKAALRVFAHRGLKDATIDAIAAEAELGRATLYYYFPSKEAILEALVMATSSYYFDGLLEGFQSEAELSAISEGLVERLLQNYQENPEAFRVLYMVLAESEPNLRRATQIFNEQHQRWLVRLEKTLRPRLRAWGIAVQPFIDFIGTHIHGIVMMAVAGRDVKKIRVESSHVLRTMLKTK
jgi:AcrR family transcriptional regulator